MTLSNRTYRIRASTQFGIIHCGAIQALTTAFWITMRPSLYQHHRSKIDTLQITCITLLTLTLLYGELATLTTTASKLSHHQLLLPWEFMMALSTIITLSTWLELTPEQCKSTIRRASILFPILLTTAYLTLKWHTDDSTRAPSFYLMLTLIIITWFSLLPLTLVRPKSPWLAISIIALNTLDLTIAATFNADRSPIPDHAATTRFAADQHNPHHRAYPRVTQFLQELKKRPLLTNLTPAATLTIDLLQTQNIPPSFRRSLLLTTITPAGQATFTKRKTIPELQLIQKYRVIPNWDPADLSPNLPPIIQHQVRAPNWPQPSPEPAYTTPPTNTTLTINANPTAPSILLINRHLNKHRQATIIPQTTHPNADRASGQPAPHFPVNGIYTGIQLDPGPHEIHLTYSPSSLKYGKILTALAALITTLGCINLAYHRFHATYLRT